MAYILVTAGLVTLIFKKIGQPVVLGYLVAGFLLGPEVNFLPTVKDRESVKVWAEIGVIFLLFSLGLEFSFRKLMSVGRGASITALIEVLFMLAIGYVTGQAFGWSAMDSLFIGGILAISSTTIIIRAFDELGLRQHGFAQLVFGVLIVEDLVAILLLVLLSTIAVTQSFAGIELITSTAKLAFFLSAWFLGGLFLIPAFLKKTRKHLNSETSLIVSLGLCLAMVLLATQAGFSPALGAFIMGSIIAETPDGERIEHNLISVKNLFSAIFFVSVGMLIQVEPLKENWIPLTVLVFVTLIGKAVSTTIGALIGGQSMKTSFQAGMSLAQIGEFSFIIATLGLSLKVTSDFLYPLAVGVSAVTTLTTPYMIRYSEPLYHWFKNKFPPHISARFEDDMRVQFVSEKVTDHQRLWITLLLNSTFVIAITLISKHWLRPTLLNFINIELAANLICLFICLTLSFPSFWYIVFSGLNENVSKISLQNVKALASYTFIIYAARWLLSLFLLGFMISQFISAFIGMLILSSAVIIIGFFGSKLFSKLYNKIENHFINQLNEKEKDIAQKENRQLAPWNSHLGEISVSAESTYVGQSLAELGIRERFGITITMIKRGQKLILAPGPQERIMPYDRLTVLGTDDQLSILNTFLTSNGSQSDESINDSNYQLTLTVIDAGHPWIGQSIREAGIRENTRGLVVGLERSGQRWLNPDSNQKFQQGDHVWLVCDPAKLPETAT